MGKKNIILDLIILVLLVVGYHIYRVGCDRWIIGVSLVICSCELVSVIVAIPKYKIRPVIVFLLSFWIVNCQFYLDLFVGLLSADFFVFRDQRLINQGVLLSALAFTSFAIGYKAVVNYEPQDNTRSSYNHTVNNFLVVFQVLSFIWWLSTLTVADFTGESYSGSGAFDKGNSITGYAEVFFVTSQILSLSYFVKKEGKAKSILYFLSDIPVLVILTSGLYIIIRLMSGDRGGAIYTTLLYFFVYMYKTRKKIKVLPFVVAVMLGAVVVTSIGMTRNDKLDLSFRKRLLYSINNRNVIDEKAMSLSPFTSELATSVHCTHVALEQTELNGRPYMHGLFHLCYVIKFIPVAGNYITYNVLGLPSFMQSSSEYVTVASSGRFYNSGLGTSTIADDYLEFGYIGVIIGLFIIGIFFKKIDTCLLFADISKTPISMIVLVLVLCYGALYIPRGIFFMFLRDWFYAMAVYLIVNTLLVKKQ